MKTGRIITAAIVLFAISLIFLADVSPTGYAVSDQGSPAIAMGMLLVIAVVVLGIFFVARSKYVRR